MPSTASDSQLIEDYYRNLLSNEERFKFEKKLESDSDFYDLYIKYGQFFKLAEQNGNKDLKSSLQTIEYNQTNKFNNPSSKNQPKTFSIRKLIYSIAAALILLLSAIYLFNLGDNTSDSNLFAEYFQPYPNTIVKLERGEAEVTELQKTMLIYSNGDFKQAINNFDLILEKGKDSDLLFYKSVSQLSIGKNEEAISILEELKDKEIPSLKEAVNWYLVLGYVKENDNIKAKKLLEVIVNSNQTYQINSAKELLKRIK